jgi:hypothetical protein
MLCWAKMTKKKANFEKTLDKAARMIQAQLDTLSAEMAAKKVRELSEIASKNYRPHSKTGTSGQARRNRAIRLSSRSRAKTA